MSYPEPIKFESAERLYKQAMFFYNQYEKKNKELTKLKSENDKLQAQNECLLLEHCLVEGCKQREQNPLPGVKKKVKKHIHGCGHPATILILCDNPIHIIEYIEWAEEHEEAEKNKKPCICFDCWIKRVRGR
jgi:hypothetical protein